MSPRILLAALAFVFAAGASQEIPAPPQAGPFALVGGTVHTLAGPEIPDATVLVEGGKVSAVAAGLKLPKGVRRIDVKGRHVYPALIDAEGELGRFEIGSIQATKDVRELGEVNPQVRSEAAVNPDSEHVGVTRANGVALALTCPEGGLIAGRSALIRLDGWTWEEMTFRAPVAMHLRWPEMIPPEEGDEEAAKRARAERDRKLRVLDEAFESARAYRAAGEGRVRDPRWEALLPVLDGTLPLVVTARDEAQIRAAAAFAQRQGARMILSGGYDAAVCADLLKERGIPVILNGVLRPPQRRDEPYDTAFTLPERLRAAGVAFCIATGEVRNARNLPYYAAKAAAHGLPREEALKSVTLYPARILGVADRVGTIEAGKDATLMVTTGDPLEIDTRVERLLIEGREVDLNDRHKRLYEKYRRRLQP